MTDVDMGLRDYRWVSEVLPGREAPMDFDCVYEKGGRFLVLEFKPEGGYLAMGQRLTLKAAVRTGHFDVLVVFEKVDGSIATMEMDRRGDLYPVVGLESRELLAEYIMEWREEHLD